MNSVVSITLPRQVQALSYADDIALITTDPKALDLLCATTGYYLTGPVLNSLMEYIDMSARNPYEGLDKKTLISPEQRARRNT